MANTVQIWRKIKTVEWEKSYRLDRADVEGMSDGELKTLLLHALDSGETTTVPLGGEAGSELDDDWAWKSDDVVESDTIQAEIEAY